jgi:hypothetical protein
MHLFSLTELPMMMVLLYLVTILENQFCPNTFAFPCAEKINLDMQRTVILHVLCRYETPGVTLREEYRLRQFENRVLRHIFGYKREKFIADWRKLHAEDLQDLYSSDILEIKLRNMGWAGRVACLGRNSIQGFGEETGRKEPTSETYM